MHVATEACWAELFHIMVDAGREGGSLVKNEEAGDGTMWKPASAAIGKPSVFIHNASVFSSLSIHTIDKASWTASTGVVQAAGVHPEVGEHAAALPAVVVGALVSRCTKSKHYLLNQERSIDQLGHSKHL